MLLGGYVHPMHRLSNTRRKQSDWIYCQQTPRHELRPPSGGGPSIATRIDSHGHPLTRSALSGAGGLNMSKIIHQLQKQVHALVLDQRQPKMQVRQHRSRPTARTLSVNCNDVGPRSTHKDSRVGNAPELREGILHTYIFVQVARSFLSSVQNCRW